MPRLKDVDIRLSHIAPPSSATHSSHLRARGSPSRSPSRTPRRSLSPEPSPLLSTVSAESADVEDYIGSGTNTAGALTPALNLDGKLSFGYDGDSPLSSHKNAIPDGHDSDEEDMAQTSYLQPGHGRIDRPLLSKNGDSSDGRRVSRSPSPMDEAKMRISDKDLQTSARTKYMYAAIFMVITLVSFTIQTELASYVQKELGWNKAYCMLYMTHGSWVFLWPVQLLILRWNSRSIPWNIFWRRHVRLLRTTAHMARTQSLRVPKANMNQSLWPYFLRITAMVTTALTIAGLSWYIAVDMTSPADLTAIYNCSAFFAYAFSVPLLREKLRLDKSFAVLIAIVGVMVVAYGDSREPDTPVDVGALGNTVGSKNKVSNTTVEESDASTRFLGNLIIGGGSVLYGLYEVLYKRWACPPEGISARRGTIFANAFGSCIGLFTLAVLWVPLPILHLLGIEKFSLPTGMTALWLWISVVMNATFAGSFLVLISLTSPVLSSVASLLTIFIVAVVDWARTGRGLSFAAIMGGVLIVVAFAMLSWSTWREMVEEEREKAASVGGAHHVVDDDDETGDDLDSDEDWDSDSP